MDSIDLADSTTQIVAVRLDSEHSRLVVFDGETEGAIGVVNAKNLLNIYLTDQSPNFRHLVREAPIIPETLDARDVVAILRDAPMHMGLVHDEYGVFQGVVTSADILEAIIGSFIIRKTGLLSLLP